VQSSLSPYLSFRDNAREAMEFYRSVFGGKLEQNTFKEFGVSSDPSEDDKIMHSVLVADNGITFMAADTPAGMEHTPGSTLSMALAGDDEAELSEYFARLAAGGTVTMPLGDAPWGAKFGALRDRFGVDWMVNIGSAEQG